MRRLAAFLLMTAIPAWGHPHVWIDVEIHPLQDAQGRIAALRQSWQFDPFYSTLLLEEILQGETPERRQALWQDLEGDIQAALSDEGLYTFPRRQFAAPRDLKLVQKGNDLFVEAELPLLEPSKYLQYQIYEPEYYVEILHAKAQPLQIGGCRLTITPAEPSEEKYMEAAALDKNQKGDPNLGRFFAETAEWMCRES